MAYEIMQNLRVDAAERYHTIDDMYYYGGQDSHYYEAVMQHKALRPDEIDMRVGDIMDMLTMSLWDGFVKVRLKNNSY
jgi:glycoprotein 6-alpha-L-fucosyltransferase